MTARSPLASAKKLTRYCCQECGAKELYLYCWKGCRHIQNLKTFYTETRAVCQEVEMLKTTIYEQELRLRDMEALLKEKQDCLDVIAEQVERLPKLLTTVTATTDTASTTTDNKLSTKRLPGWACEALALLVDKFDGNKDGHLNRTEFATLCKPLKSSGAMLTHSEQENVDVAALATYYERVGVVQLTDDLRTHGIQLGATPSLVEILTQTLHHLRGFAKQANELQGEVATLKSEVNEKARATTRLREGFAEVKMALDGKDNEIQRVEKYRSHADKELQATRDQMTSLSSELKKIMGELTARNTALHDLRALVEDQVHEKEKWQRYCWELEERLYDAVHTSHVKERDLWKTRDAKKEEARKNMLLYMDRGMGKKHFAGAAVGAGDKGGIECLDDADTSCCSSSDGGSVIHDHISHVSARAWKNTI